MSILGYIAGAVGVLAFVLAVVWSRPGLPRQLSRTVIVHTTDARSLRGVLVAEHRDVLVLAHAAYLVPDGSEEPVEGEVLVLRDRVSFVQVV